MTRVTPALLDLLRFDLDGREERLRELVEERLEENPPPSADDFIVASYFFVLRDSILTSLASEIAYHATSGTKYPPPDSLLEECTGKALAVDAFDKAGRIGLIHMGFPLKMMLHPD